MEKGQINEREFYKIMNRKLDKILNGKQNRKLANQKYVEKNGQKLGTLFLKIGNRKNRRIGTLKNVGKMEKYRKKFKKELGKINKKIGNRIKNKIEMENISKRKE